MQEFHLLRAELLLKGRNDPIFFAEYFLGLKLNPFQKRYLRTKSKMNLVVCGNQVGKTFAIAVLHIYFNFYKIYLDGEPQLIADAEYKTLNLSPISRQARNAFKYVVQILESRFSWELDGVREVNQCKIGWFLRDSKEYLGTVYFNNETMLHCVSTHQDKGASIQGDQFGLITYDEANQSHHLKDELDARIFSRIARLDGRVDLIATPDEQAKSQQYWYNLYSTALKAEKEGSDAEWKLYRGYYDDNIFIPFEKQKSFKKRMMRRNPILYRQVVLGEFTVQADKMFAPKVIQAFWNGKTKPTSPKEERDYVITVDWGVAEQGDPTVMKVCDYTDFLNAEIVHHYSKRGGDPIELMAMLQHLWLEYYEAKVILDVASLGGAVFRKMLRHLKPISFPSQKKANALTFLQIRLRNNLKNTSKLSEEEKNAISKLKSYYIHEDENQLASYKIDDKKLDQDNVMTLAQLAWFLDRHLKVSQVKTFKFNIRTGFADPPEAQRRRANIKH